jgi:ankyrin repeat protein
MASGDALLDAAKGGDVRQVRTLLAEDRALAALQMPSGETPLMAALYRGHMNIVEALLEAGAPLDVFAAAALGKVDEIDRILGESPASVNAFAYDGWTPLHLAAFFGRHDMADRLLQAGADMSAESRNSIRNTPLHAALAGNHPDIALLLIERGAPVGARDAGGHTPLHIAAENGSVDAVKALLARGADPHGVDGEEKTPLARAAARNHAAVIDAITLHRS